MAEAMQIIDCANVACGVHAGSHAQMEAALELGARFHTKVGAHPGLPEQNGRGGGSPPSPLAFEALVTRQIQTLLDVANAKNYPLTHVKLHGILYHWSDQYPEIAQRYVDLVRLSFPGMAIIARAGGLTAQTAKYAGLRVWEEIFADRHYLDNGLLVPRSAPHALIIDGALVEQRIQSWLQDRTIFSLCGKPLHLSAETICVHSDTPESLVLIRKVREILNAIPLHET